MAQIKDFVEIAAYDEQVQFRDAESERLISAYLLTELTAAALTSLLEYLRDPTQMTARMICGPRGVGKSHLLAVVHHLLDRPQQRTRLEHQQLRAVAARLGTLLPITVSLDGDLRIPFSDALAAAIRVSTHGAISFMPSGDRVRDLQLLADSSPGAAPVLLVDGMSMRLRSGLPDRCRDDIAWLGALGTIAQTGKLKAIVTLDDELIGSNSDLTALAQNYHADRLGLDCLKQIISQKLFKKTSKQRAELQHLYAKFKRRLPSLPWDEGDFVALYPLHPVLLEIAPAIRAHSPGFSLLGFAATAAIRAMGRPSLSLILLDEVFDRFEYDLRKSEALTRLFAAYDKLANSIPAAAPVAQRMTTRLLLKSLALLSLSERGVTLNRLCEALMLVDERIDGYKLVADSLNEMLGKFGDAITVDNAGEQPTYLLPLGGDRDIDSLVKMDAAQIDDADPRLLEVLIGVGGRSFTDWPFAHNRRTMEFSNRAVLRILWRGAEREGLLCFNTPIELNGAPESAHQSDPTLPDISGRLLELDLEGSAGETAQIQPRTFSQAGSANDWDWQVVILPPGASVAGLNSLQPGVVFWLTKESEARFDLDGRKTARWRNVAKHYLVAQTLSLSHERTSPRLEVLLKDLRGALADDFARIYLKQGELVSGHSRIPLEDHRPASTICEFLARLLEPMLTMSFPQHPQFGGLLTAEKIDALCRGLLCGAEPNDALVQAYAEQFAAPLSLLRRVDGNWRLDAESDEYATAPALVALHRFIDTSPEGVVSLADATALLRRHPFGLTLPAQRLLLAALVAGWRAELTNAAGTHVLTPANLADGLDFSRYTLLRRTSVIGYSTERLGDWCSRLFNQSSWFDLRSPDGRRQLRESLSEWQERWTKLDLDRRMLDLPDESMTARVAQMYATCKRYFDRMAAAVGAMLQGRMLLEQGLAHIVDIFAGNELLFDRLMQELNHVSVFLDWAPWSARFREYVMTADYTGSDDIELIRRQLHKCWEEPNRLLDDATRQNLAGKADEFAKKYRPFYIAAHNSARRKVALGAFADLLISNEWLKCQAEIKASGLSERRLAITSLVNELNSHHCMVELESLLETTSHCACGFSLAVPDEPEQLLSMLRRLLAEELGGGPTVAPTGALRLPETVESADESDYFIPFIKSVY